MAISKSELFGRRGIASVAAARMQAEQQAQAQRQIEELRQQAEQQAQQAEQEIAEVQEKRKSETLWQARVYDDSSVLGKGYFPTGPRFKTREEAVAYARESISENWDVREEQAIIEPQPQITQTREQRIAESREKHALERKRLAEQAAEKASSGEQLSVAERAAFQRLSGKTVEQALEEARQSASEQRAKTPATQKEISQSILRKQIEQGTGSLFARQAQIAAEEASKGVTAGELIRGFRMVPKQYQTPETQRAIAEASVQRQLSYAPLAVLGQPRQISTEEVMPYAAAGRGIESIKTTVLINQSGNILTTVPLEVKPTLKRESLKGGFDTEGGDGRPSRSISKSDSLISRNILLSPLSQKEIAGQKARELASQARAERTKEFFRIIPGLRGNNFAQRATRYALALPTLATIGIGEVIASSGEKTILSIKGLSFKETREATKRELIRAAKQTPSESIQFINPSDPEGLVNLLALGIGLKSKGKAQARAQTATEALKGKTTAEVTLDRNLPSLFVKPRPLETIKSQSKALVPLETLPSTLIRVRELQGVKIEAKGLITGFQEEAALNQRPILGKSELIDIRDIEKPELVLIRAEGSKVTERFTQKASRKGEFTGEELKEGIHATVTDISNLGIVDPTIIGVAKTQGKVVGGPLFGIIGIKKGIKSKLRRDVLEEEFSHLYDERINPVNKILAESIELQKLENRNLIRNREEINKLYSKNERIREINAGVITLYRTNPSQLKEIAPRTFEIIDQQFKEAKISVHGEIYPSQKINIREPINQIRVLTPEEAAKFRVPRTEVRGLAREFSPVTEIIKGQVNLFFEPLKLIKGVPARRPQQPSSTGKVKRQRLEGAEEKAQIGQILKLPADYPIVQFAEKQSGRIVAVEIRKTPQGLIRTVREKEVPQVFVKDAFGFGKKKVIKESQNIIRGPEQTTTESGGLIQLLAPTRQRVAQKAKVEARQEIKHITRKDEAETFSRLSERLTPEEVLSRLSERLTEKGAFSRLSERLGRKKAKRQGIFIIEEFIPRQRNIFATVYPTALGAARKPISLIVPILAQQPSQDILLGTQLSPRQAIAQQAGLTPRQDIMQAQQPAVAQSPISLQSSFLGVSQAVSQSVTQAVAQSVSAMQAVAVSQQVATQQVSEKLQEKTRLKERIRERIRRRGGEKEKGLLQEKGIGGQAPSYDIQLRKGEKRGDKFVTVEKNLPRNKALKRLAFIIDNYIEASGRLKPSNRPARSPDDLTPPNLSKFRSPKKGSRLPRDTIIELLNKRLDTEGEKRQISFFRQQQLKQALRKAIKRKTRQKIIGAGINRRITSQNFFTSNKNNNIGFIGKPRRGKTIFL